jgi:small-conductance mechanosensitive channel
MYDIMNTIILNNRVLDYFRVLGIFIFSIIALKIFKNVILKRLKKFAETTKTILDDFFLESFNKKVVPFLYFVALYLSLQGLFMNAAVKEVINVIFVILLTFFGVRFLLTVLIYSLEIYWVTKEKDEEKQGALKGMLTVVKVVVWSAAVIILLDNLGIKISAVVAGLGIGGIAIALAAQAILGDLFSYFTIFFDRPFEIGDFIISGEYMGVVEHIGIKTTRIRSLGGEQLVFSNTDLTNSRVRNYKRMEKRRVVFKIGVTYQTSLEKLKEIPVAIKAIIENTEEAVFDRAHFASYGDFSLDFEIVYYVMGSDYNKYMDIHQQINFGIREEFDKRSIEFAYPTQTLYVEK